MAACGAHGRHAIAVLVLIQAPEGEALVRAIARPRSQRHPSGWRVVGNCVTDVPASSHGKSVSLDFHAHECVRLRMANTDMTCVGFDKSYAELRALVKLSLRQLQWRHHGIGVLQGYVSQGADPEVRVHIWSPELVKPGMTESGDVHNHRFDMVSHVLLGTVGHEEWEPIYCDDGEYTTMKLTHARAASDTKYHGPTTPTGRRLRVRRYMTTIPEGNFYTFPAGLFHRSPVICPMAVTCVKKRNQGSWSAEILHPIEIPPVMAFGHDVDKSMVERIVSAAYNQL